MKDKRGITITNAFQEILDESNCKPNKIWVDKGSEFYNRSIKLWLEKKRVKIFVEGKSIIAERFIRTLKNKIYKYMISISKNDYCDELVDLVNKYNNMYHSTIKMPVDVKSSTYTDSSK